jgi:subtilisin family serine protease
MPIRALRHLCTPLLPSAGERCSAEGSVQDARAGVRWAVDHGANVVNLSVADDVLTRTATGSPLAEEIRAAWRRGVIVVVAAGNDLDASGSSGYGDLPVLVVGATDHQDRKAPYSNSVGDARWGLVAPGGAGDGECPAHDVVSTYLRGSRAGGKEGYACLSGTSMAAPHVAGAAAVLLSMGLSPQQVIDRLLATADDLGAPGRDGVFGTGRLNLRRAVAEGARQPAPAPAPTAPPTTADAPAAAAAASPASPQSTLVAPSPDIGTPRVAEESVGTGASGNDPSAERAIGAAHRRRSGEAGVGRAALLAAALIVATGLAGVRVLSRTGRVRAARAPAEPRPR